jgi:hypothetical protein
LASHELIFERFMVSSHFFIEKVTFLYYSCNEKKNEEVPGLTFDIILNQAFLDKFNAFKRKAAGDDV